MKLSNLRKKGRFLNPETGQQVNVWVGRKVDYGVDVLFYLKNGKRHFISDKDFYDSWITKSKRFTLPDKFRKLENIKIIEWYEKYLQKMEHRQNHLSKIISSMSRERKEMIEFIESLKSEISFKIDKNECIDFVIRSIKKDGESKIDS